MTFTCFRRATPGDDTSPIRLCRCDEVPLVLPQNLRVVRSAVLSSARVIVDGQLANTAMGEGDRTVLITYGGRIEEVALEDLEVVEVRVQRRKGS